MGFISFCALLKQSRLILATQAWKQTLPPSDWTLYYTLASVCKYLSCKIGFNVFNYVFILGLIYV